MEARRALSEGQGNFLSLLPSTRSVHTPFRYTSRRGGPSASSSSTRARSTRPLSTWTAPKGKFCQSLSSSLAWLERSGHQQVPRRRVKYRIGPCEPHRFPRRRAGEDEHAPQRDKPDPLLVSQPRRSAPQSITHGFVRQEFERVDLKLARRTQVLWKIVRLEIVGDILPRKRLRFPRLDG